MFSADVATAIDADHHAVEAFGQALAGSDRPFIIASGLAGLPPGTRDRGRRARRPTGRRSLSKRAVLALADLVHRTSTAFRKQALGVDAAAWDHVTAAAATEQAGRIDSK